MSPRTKANMSPRRGMKITPRRSRRYPTWQRVRLTWNRQGMMDMPQTHPMFPVLAMVKRGIADHIRQANCVNSATELTTNDCKHVFTHDYTTDKQKTRFKSYASCVFASIRHAISTTESDYLKSMCPPNRNYLVFDSNSKSGSQFFLSNDKRYFLKTEKIYYIKSFLKLLKSYLNHFITYPHSLIVKYVGVYSATTANGKTIYFLVMENIFYPSERVEVKYDLKGCNHGRYEQPQISPVGIQNVLKDRNFDGEVIELGYQSGWFMRQIQLDIEFMRQEGLMDYSLLIGRQCLTDEEKLPNLPTLVCRMLKSKYCPIKEKPKTKRKPSHELRKLLNKIVKSSSDEISTHSQSSTTSYYTQHCENVGTLGRWCEPRRSCATTTPISAPTTSLSMRHSDNNAISANSANKSSQLLDKTDEGAPCLLDDSHAILEARESDVSLKSGHGKPRTASQIFDENHETENKKIGGGGNGIECNTLDDNNQRNLTDNTKSLALSRPAESLKQKSDSQVRPNQGQDNVSTTGTATEQRKAGSLNRLCSKLKQSLWKKDSTTKSTTASGSATSQPQQPAKLSHSLILAPEKPRAEVEACKSCAKFTDVLGCICDKGINTGNRRLLNDSNNALHVIDGEETRYFVGFIDFFTRYELKQRLDRMRKTVKYKSWKHSTLPPDAYANRILAFINEHTE